MCKSPNEQNLLSSISECIDRSKKNVVAHNYDQAAFSLQSALCSLGTPEDEKTRSFKLSLQIALAEVIRLQGRFGDAAQLLQRVVKQSDQLSEYHLLKKAAARNALGVVYKYLGKLDSAKNLYCQAFRLSRRDKTVAKSALCTVLYNMAGLLNAMHRYEQGCRFARRALALVDNKTTEDVCNQAIIQSCLAANLEGMQKFDDAQSLYWDSIEILRSTHGDIHRDIAVNLNNLGHIALLQGQLDTAERLLGEAIDIKRALLGPKHPDTAITLFNLAKLSLRRGQTEWASKQLIEAHKIFVKSFGPAHFKTKAAAEQLKQLSVMTVN